MNSIKDDSTLDALCFGAHPDDVEMGMGGTVAALTAAGKRVGIVALTRGELGSFGDATTREAEARKAAEILGCKLILLDMPDGGVQDDLVSRHRLVGLLREMRPPVVFAPYGYSRTGPMDGRSNVDHLACGRMVSAACKLARFRKLFPETEPHGVRRIYSYMVPVTLAPSVVVDVSAQRETLVAAIEAYASQMAIQRGAHGALDFLLLFRQELGIRSGVELAEAFHCEDPIGGDPELLLRL
jgi:bacillithiol biosynthesis deacetylase BshB1